MLFLLRYTYTSKDRQSFLKTLLVFLLIVQPSSFSLVVNFKIKISHITASKWCMHAYPQIEERCCISKCSKMLCCDHGQYICDPKISSVLDAQTHLKNQIIYILISKDLHIFMKFCALVFEFSRSQVIYGWCGATTPKSIYPRPHLGM